MKVDLYLYRPALDEMPGRGRQAEQGGFDGLFVAESTGTRSRTWPSPASTPAR